MRRTPRERRRVMTSGHELAVTLMARSDHNVYVDIPLVGMLPVSSVSFDAIDNVHILEISETDLCRAGFCRPFADGRDTCVHGRTPAHLITPTDVT